MSESFSAARTRPLIRCWPSTTLNGPTRSVSIVSVLLPSSNGRTWSVARKIEVGRNASRALCASSEVVGEVLGSCLIEQPLIAHTSGRIECVYFVEAREP